MCVCVCVCNLMKYLTHYYHYGWGRGRKEGSILFNDTLNTFSYGYMVSNIC